jgi:hypothetical protein
LAKSGELIENKFIVAGMFQKEIKELVYTEAFLIECIQ